jgi:uncharacterized glyoxalase superfamily protein PhnB
MAPKIVPMIQVPDVSATVQWYSRLGFVVRSTHEEGGETDWASMTYGESEVMFNAGGQPSSANRREIDLYARVPDVAALCERLRGTVDLVEDVHDTFYGQREFIIRDINGFRIIFGEPLSSTGS